MRIKVIIFLAVICFYSTAQSSFRRSNTDYLSIESGLVIDTYNSLGARLAFEYQKQLKTKWLYGIAFEHSRHFDYAYRDRSYKLPTNLNILSLNGYYRINLTKQLLYWTAGGGIGLVHVQWLDKDKLGITLNASVTLNIQLTERIIIITSPLLILLPANRIHYSPLKLNHFNSFHAYPIFPLGIKVLL